MAHCVLVSITRPACWSAAHMPVACSWAWIWRLADAVASCADGTDSDAARTGMLAGSLFVGVHMALAHGVTLRMVDADGSHAIA